MQDPFEAISFHICESDSIYHSLCMHLIELTHLGVVTMISMRPLGFKLF